jgi:hypothetical protein
VGSWERSPNASGPSSHPPCDHFLHVSRTYPQYGYRLTPRIRNLGDRKLFVIRPSADYAALAPLIGGTANLAIVEENWDEMLRLWASIAAGLVPPSVILKKIAAVPRQNVLAKALREIGRLEHSIFIYVTWNRFGPDTRCGRRHGDYRVVGRALAGSRR